MKYEYRIMQREGYDEFVIEEGTVTTVLTRYGTSKVGMNWRRMMLSPITTLEDAKEMLKAVIKQSDHDNASFVQVYPEVKSENT